MKFPVTLVLEDTTKEQKTGLRKAIAKNNKAFKALVAGGYVVPEAPKAPKAPKDPKKPSKK
jgi:hypothetical protein